MSKRKANAPNQGDAKMMKPGGHWSQGLLAAVDDPILFTKSDDLVNVIKDKYPKAKFHYLILSKEKITNLKAVTANHGTLLKHMEEVALQIARDKKHEGIMFKVGYHAEPSMSRLHLHVISDDMNSECLKTKKHWNSFNTDFFIESEEIRRNLEENGRIILPSREECKEYMEAPLKCHKCDFKPRHMPDLKKHILTHFN